jgi:hypothetical protein
MMPFFLLMGVTNLLKYSEKLLDASDNVRVVHIIGLSSAGAMCGIAWAGLMVALFARNWIPEGPTKMGKPTSPGLEADAHAA